jgi:Bacterial cadherin-like domain
MRSKFSRDGRRVCRRAWISIALPPAPLVAPALGRVLRGERSAGSGNLILVFDGSFTYAPTANYRMPDQFAAQTKDGTQAMVARVKMSINAVNDPPVTRRDAHTISRDKTLSVAAPGVLGNDTDVDGDSLLAVLVSPPSHGKLTFLTNGSSLYEPNTNYNGADTFLYKANDGTDSAPQL